MNILDRTALKAIACYKTGISPHKGFKCAYSVTHGISCSTVAENLIKEHGVMDARPFIKQQFQDCTAEYERLIAEEASNPDPAKKQRTSKAGNACNSCDTSACSIPWLFPSRKSSGSNSCDVVDCDIGGCDL